MTDIAERAGCTTGMVTYYFDDKDEVLLAGLRSVSLVIRDRVRRRLEADPLRSCRCRRRPSGSRCW